MMGSKNLKAVVLRGNQPIRIRDEAGFKAVVDRCRKKPANSITRPGNRQTGEDREVLNG